MLIAILPFFLETSGWLLFGVWLLLSGSHAAIDLVKWKAQGVLLNKNSDCESRNQEAWLFFIDQAVHVLCIILVLLTMPLETAYSGYSGITQTVSMVMVRNVAAVVLIVLFLCKPASIMVRIVLRCVQQDDEQEKSGIEKAGTAIGMLERLIIATFTLCGQPAAIAFVIAAKSLARFKQLESQAFAERYLVGTLLSSFLALTASLGAQLFLMG